MKKRKSGLKRVLAVLLTAVMVLSLYTMALAEEGEAACTQTAECAAKLHEEGCPKAEAPETEEADEKETEEVTEEETTPETTVAEGEATEAVPDETKEALTGEEPEEAKDTKESGGAEAPAAAVQAMIDALPGKEEITAENAEAVKVQLAAIDEAKASLSEEELDGLDIAKYVEAAGALGSVYDADPLAGNVAKIGDKEYETLSKAVTAAKASSVIVLIDDVIDCGKITLSRTKQVKIDLNGHNIGFKEKGYFLIQNSAKLTLTGTGKVYEQVPQNAPVVLKGTTRAPGATVTVESGVTLEGASGLMIDKNSSNNGIVANISGTLVGKRNANGNPGSGLYVNGNIKKSTAAPKITLDGATVKAEDGGAGMYLAGYTETVIKNSKVESTAEGGVGIEIRAGNLTISDSTVTGGSGTYEFIGNGSGSTSSNVALALSQHTTQQPLHVVVESGNFNGGAAIAEANPQHNPTEATDKVSLEILGGNFEGEVYSEDKEEFISGGTYSEPVDNAYVAAGNQSIPNPDGGGDYTIGVNTATAAAKIGDFGYPTLQEAVEKAKPGETITLVKDTEEDVEIPEGTDVVLDLGGKKLTVPTDGGLKVLGTLKVQDSAGGGTITSAKTPVKVSGENAQFTLESGKVESSGDYGVYVTDGGSASVNGGEIHSCYAALSGNNTTGNMNFEVNGGTLTADYGPAIYMPGQMKLKITDGEINGGVSLRMGQVDISGGTIHAATENLDDPKDYYDYSGNAFLPDALYVFGGTYTSDDPNYNNSLNLNITGGTFSCANGKGSAVAIYDLGKTGQEENVAISGTAVLTTDAPDRMAYQVLTLEDLGVEDPAYGAESGKVNTAVSGGSFSTEVLEEYCAEDFHPNKNSDGTYSVHVHAPAEEKANVKAATCTEAGYTGDTMCSICGEVMETGSMVFPTEHTAAAEKANVKAATCTEAGYSGDVVCGVCGKVLEAGKATPVTSHTFQWILDKKPTTSEKGIKHEECKICGYKKAAVEIPAVVPGKGDTTAPATGQTTHPLLWAVLLVIAFCGLMGVLIYSKKQKKHRNR